MIAAVLLALALPAAADPFDAKADAWKAKGYGVRERLSRSVGDLTAAVAIYSPESGGDRLEIYVATKGKAYLGYAHPSSVERLELDPSPDGRFTDLLGDGSRIIAYRSTNLALKSVELNLVRWKKFELKRVAVYPDGRFLPLDGKPGIASRSLPLGPFLSVACEDFGTMSRTAYRTRLFAARGGALKDVSDDYPSFYESEIARKKASLERLKDSLEKNAGEYLGLAISSYYDYAAIGRAKAGWTSLRSFFALPAYAPAAAKSCMAAMEKDLRGRLDIPASWP